MSLSLGWAPPTGTLPRAVCGQWRGQCCKQPPWLSLSPSAPRSLCPAPPGSPPGPWGPQPTAAAQGPPGRAGAQPGGPPSASVYLQPPGLRGQRQCRDVSGKEHRPHTQTPHTPHPRPLRAARLSQSRGWSWAGGRGLCWEPGLEGQVPGWAGVSARCRGWRLGVPGWKVKSRAGQRGRAGPCGAVQLRTGRGAGPAARQHLSRPCEWPRTHFPAPAAPIKERRSQIRHLRK